MINDKTISSITPTKGVCEPRICGKQAHLELMLNEFQNKNYRMANVKESFNIYSY